VWNTARQLITDPTLVWPGQKAIAYICASGYENQSRGVHFFISAIQIVGDGERIGFDPDSLGNVFEQRDPVPGAPEGMFESVAPTTPAPTPRPTPVFPASSPAPAVQTPVAAGVAPAAASDDFFKF